jgi:hypothetical protein
VVDGVAGIGQGPAKLLSQHEFVFDDQDAHTS